MTDRALIRCPWPATPLSPNARTHWATKAKYAKALKEASHKAAEPHVEKLKGRNGYTLTLTFHPPQNRRYDIDNLLARCKAMLDGIADALNADDRTFRINLEPVAEKTKGGCVFVSVEPTDA